MSRIDDLKSYQQLYQKSLKESEKYWEMVASDFDWFKKWEKVSSGDFHNLEIKWFEGGKTNMSMNCLDRHIKDPELANKNAVIFVPNDPSEQKKEFTYKQLYEQVCRFSNVLKNNGIKKGDVVCFYMGMTPELLIGILACTRVGAIHSVVFGGFSAKALSGRINDCQAKMIITHDGGLRGQKVVPLKDITDEAVKECPSVSKVLVSKRAHNQIQFNSKLDVWLEEEMQKADTKCDPEIMDSEAPLFILYTSGSTGKPKGLLHTTAGYMVNVAHTFDNVFQMEKDDIYWCTADIGWITGHSYLTYGPLLNGATTVMFEGVPTWPDAGRFWQIVDEIKVTHFYTAPTAIRALEAAGVEHVRKHKLDSLKVLGTVGEPINEEAWEWYNEEVGKKRCPIVDTWWQTETGAIMISPLAHITPLTPSCATHPLPGISPILVDQEGKEIEESVAEGNLCITRPWPSMARTIYGDHERYRQTYFSTYPGLYFTGDGAKRFQNGHYRITGRVDDVINVSGHRIGTAEVEDALDEHPKVYESAVVGYPHDIKGQGIYAYLICHKEIFDNKDKSETIEKLKKELDEIVIKMIGPIAKADKIQIVSELPKTRSGKIMRRILRKIAAQETDQLGDTSTLLNPEIVEELIQGRRD